MFRSDALLKPGEKIFVVERRLFKDDLRRHFVGEVELCTNVGFRAKGYPFYYHEAERSYVRKARPRTRAFTFNSNLIIYLLPRDSDIESVNYVATEKKLTLTDRRSFELDVSDPDHR